MWPRAPVQACSAPRGVLRTCLQLERVASPKCPAFLGRPVPMPGLCRGCRLSRASLGQVQGPSTPELLAGLAEALPRLHSSSHLQDLLCTKLVSQLPRTLTMTVWRCMISEHLLSFHPSFQNPLNTSHDAVNQTDKVPVLVERLCWLAETEKK